MASLRRGKGFRVLFYACAGCNAEVACLFWRLLLVALQTGKTPQEKEVFASSKAASAIRVLWKRDTSSNYTGCRRVAVNGTCYAEGC